MRHVVTFYAILILAGAILWRLVAMVNRWLKRRVLARIERPERLYAAAATGGSGVPAFHAGGPVSTPLMVGLSAGSTISQVCGSLDEKPKPLEETWSNEKVEAWRVIDVTVKEGDDGMWMGFPHPDGPTDDVVTPVRHPVGVELHAECKRDSLNEGLLPECDETPGERCASGYGSGCGFYAYKTRGSAVTYIVAARFSPWDAGSQAVAKVLLSGKVIEHEDGYRAEILEVVSIEPVPYPSLGISFEEATAAIMNLAPGYRMLTPIPLPPPNLFINLGGGS